MTYQEVLQIIENDSEYIRLKSGCVDVSLPGETFTKTILKADLVPGKYVVSPTHCGSPIEHKLGMDAMRLRERIKVKYGFGGIGFIET